MLLRSVYYEKRDKKEHSTLIRDGTANWSIESNRILTVHPLSYKFSLSNSVENAQKIISFNGEQREEAPRFGLLRINGITSEDGVGIRTEELVER